MVAAGGLEPPMFTRGVTVLQTAAVATAPRCLKKLVRAGGLEPPKPSASGWCICLFCYARMPSSVFAAHFNTQVLRLHVVVDAFIDRLLA